MARRNSTAVLEDENTTTETTEEAAVEEAPEQVEAPAAETPVEGGDDQPVAEAASTGSEADLTPFITVAETVVGERDSSTGTLPEGGLERVLEAYRELPDTKARNRAKKHLNEAMAKGLEEMDLGVAKAYLTLHDNMTTATKSASTPRQPADPKARWQQQLEIVTLAYGELLASAPEGVDEDAVQAIVNGTASLSEDMAAQRAYLDADEPAEGEEAPAAPEVDDRVKAAFRLVRGGKISGGGSARVSTPHDGPRRDIAKHIQAAFADKESGDFLTVAQIRAHKSEEYGDELPSAGAISARLFPAKGECTVQGVIPGSGGDKNQRGARKA